jgi:hypothetical protein
MEKRYFISSLPLGVEEAARLALALSYKLRVDIYAKFV